MSVEAIHGEHSHSDDPHLAHAHHFKERKQQDESYLVGMWTFLVTEIMFFGALFLAYMIYRTIWPGNFAEVSREHLDVKLGFLNTLILLTSSFTMAMAVQSAQRKLHGRMQLFMVATMGLACCFMVVKYFEYSKKYYENHIPGPLFHYEEGGHGAGHASAEGAKAEHSGGESVSGEAHGRKHSLEPERGQKSLTAQRAEVFFSLYFIMTGLHGIHVILGVLTMGIILFMFNMGSPLVQDFMPIEMTGLYWHFVDIVWIFLYPALYLIHPDFDKFKFW
jgi:cytochrome c oxidase subunit 3